MTTEKKKRRKKRFVKIKVKLYPKDTTETEMVHIQTPPENHL